MNQFIKRYSGPSATMKQAVTSINGQPYEIGKRWLKIGTSVGASLFPDDTENIHGLVHMADVRM
jgi:predicted signal transduction protein with EAL and GGDEF domain